MKRDIIYIDRAPVGRFPNSTANQKCHWGDSTCLKFTLFLISEKVSWFLWLKLTTATSIIVSKENFLLRGSLGPCTLIHMNLHMWQQDLPKYQVLFFCSILLQCKLLSNCILNPESRSFSLAIYNTLRNLSLLLIANEFEICWIQINLLNSNTFVKFK